MLQVKITTFSALMLGSGTGRGSFIDEDIIFDEYGLPLFPGRRLKGLLRESAVEVMEMLEQCGLNRLFGDDILEIVFGSSTSSASIRVNNLYLTDSQNTDNKTIVKWLRYIGQEHAYFVNKESVVNALTDIRQQTAINKEGYAKANSLRTMRILKPNQEFTGIIEVLKKDRQSEIEALLALACSNLKRVGSGRNRGWGEIKCCLYTDNGTDLNKGVIDKLKNCHGNDKLFIRVNNEDRNNRDAGDLKIEFSKQLMEQAILEYRITSLSPLLFTSPDGDENMVCTLNHIPGSALHGYYANQFIRERNLDPSSAHQNQFFRSWFLEGKLSFSNAYPVCQTLNRPLYPTPFFLHTDKQETRPYNLIRKFSSDTKAIGDYCTIIGNKLHKYETEKVINFHLVRNKESHDYDARIEGNVQEGGIFHYEAIKPGQEFHGYICGAKAELEFFRQMFGGSGNSNIRLGRSLNTQYGAAKIEFDEVVINSYSIPNASLLGEDEDAATDDLFGRILLYLSSPLIITNSQGFSSTDEKDLVKYLQARLDIANIKIKNSFAKVETRQSFASHLRIHDPGFRYWSVGSSFLLELCDDNDKLVSIDEELQAKLNRLMIEGIGEKRHMGYGQIEFFTQVPIVNDFYNLPKEKLQKPESSMPILVQIIIEATCHDNLQRILAAAAAKRAKDYYKANKHIRLSSNLLGRLEIICRNSSDAKDFGEKVKNLRETAIRPLKGMRLRHSCLYDDLIDMKLETCYRGTEHWKLLSKMADDMAIKITPDYKTFWRLFFRIIRKLQKNDQLQERGGKDNVL